MNNRIEQQIRIAGPCAVESVSQWEKAIVGLRDHCDIIRGGVWKPRTKPGWDGMGSEALIPMLEIATKHGITPAMEVLVPEHVDEVAQAMRAVGGNSDEAMQVVVWVGSRNQNHVVQQGIGQRVNEGPGSISVGIKNAPWASIDHTVGIAQHLMASGLPQDRLAWLALRGFDPSILDFIGGWNEGGVSIADTFNPDRLRNIPPTGNWVGRLRTELNRQGISVPLIADPSHIAGRADLVQGVLEHMLSTMGLDGFMTEVHPNPHEARTDARQQLSIEEFAAMMEQLDAKHLLW
ncbi:hypothetical protein COU89_01460 [Candidatus Roizmanbacteria bacterium CG10_big_fil_rev_8_21_14_0_10_45_7]|uniref:DAHP synthetase I/KDSA domain-containing protein n=1 Tax=Candidatus Roizmanbacteria bacterium CG10_big_fil_rev_8_21_14_0_10_45_7 TaxID=1974854 RepID=A0A2M8KV35_9BACT|nr:MAG: hypothetical protein COU89_01460 [Candidatus Roizmanbacteria bacterium CG10_big_fil_rev_8_21_14_0_10_45_7]